MKSTAVSVVIPCWGAYTKYLVNAIDSVRDQAAEIIVVGNQEALTIAEKHNVRGVKAPRPFALSTARRAGIAEASYPMVCRLDCDDVMLPDKLQFMAQSLANHPSAIAISGSLGDEDGNPVWPSKRLAKLVAKRWGGPLLLFKNVLVVNDVCVAYQRPMLTATIDADYEHEDWHEAIKLRRQGQVIFIPEVMATYNRREGSRSRQELDVASVKLSHDQLIHSALSVSGHFPKIWQAVDIVARIARAITRKRTLRAWNVTDLLARPANKS